MSIKILLWVVVLKVCFSGECGRVKRVVGGVEVECGTQPRVASLQNSTSLQHLCGATVLTAELALTAAHCVHFKHDQYLLQLNNHCEGPPPKAHVLEIIPQASYDKASRSHDLALLRIQLQRDDITWLGDVLPQSSFGVSGQCAIYGYGTRDPLSSETSEVLMAGDVKIVSLDECTSALGPIAPAYDAGMVCALGEGMDACQGDSGSPLICESAIQGVSSYGLSCGVRGVPGVYTSIGPHLTWIRDVIRKSNSIKLFNKELSRLRSPKNIQMALR